LNGRGAAALVIGNGSTSSRAGSSLVALFSIGHVVDDQQIGIFGGRDLEISDREVILTTAIEE
jgi:hypothetical protein